MNDLRKMENDVLLSYTKRLADEEWRISLRMIECLREVERRMLFAESYSSLFDFAVRYLGLTEDAANLRISAMRLGRDNAVAKAEMESGRLILSNAAQLQTFFLAEKKQGKEYTPEKKAEVIQSVVGLSKRECQRALLALAPESIPQEKQRLITSEKTELRIVLDEAVMKKFEALREFLSHSHPHATFAEMIEWMLDGALEKLHKEKFGAEKAEGKKAKPENAEHKRAESESVVTKNLENEPGMAMDSGTGAGPGVEQKPRPSVPGQVKTARKYISVADRRSVNLESQGSCTYMGPDGKRCGSRYQFQVDHRQSLFTGGLNERANYRGFCGVHNRYEALKQVGREVMETYVASLKG